MKQAFKKEKTLEKGNKQEIQRRKTCCERKTFLKTMGPGHQHENHKKINKLTTANSVSISLQALDTYYFSANMTQ